MTTDTDTQTLPPPPPTECPNCKTDLVIAHGYRHTSLRNFRTVLYGFCPNCAQVIWTQANHE